MMIPTIEIKCDMCYNSRSVLEVIIVLLIVFTDQNVLQTRFDLLSQWIVILVEFYR